jgi:ferritin-like metal-binding protein YciE
MKTSNDKPSLKGNVPNQASFVGSGDLPNRTSLNKDQLHALLYESLETEKGGVLVYETALRCAVNKDLKQEWQKYLEQTRNHVVVLTNVLKSLGLNPDQETPGRNVVRFSGQSLVRTMEVALMAGKPLAAQVVAAECVVQAETKDHMNWELLAVAAESLTDIERKNVIAAVSEVEEEEDEHLYHSRGWARELHLQLLGLPAQLPPAEEEQDVTTELEAATVVKERKETLTATKKARKK